MTSTFSSDTTLLTEHLTYRPVALIDDIINSINELAFRATDAVEKGLLSAPLSDIGFRPADKKASSSASSSDAVLTEAAKHEIENGVHQLETLLEAKIDKNFDKLEVYALRNILSVPLEVRDWVRLSHYEGLNFDVKENDGAAPSRESILLQRKKLRETLKLQVFLRAEKERNERTLRELRGLLGQIDQRGFKKEESETEQEPGKKKEQDIYPTLAFLQNKGDLMGDVERPISTTTKFAISQLPALKGLMTGLEGRLKELAEGERNGGLVGEEEKSWRRQRLEFVELEAKRYLEKERGLELDEQGVVREGEWQGEGRRLAKGEAEDLEKVAGMVGSHAAGDDAMDEGE